MLDKDTRDSLAREMRKRYDGQPKGEMPDRLWRLLLQLEQSCGSRSERKAA